MSFFVAGKPSALVELGPAAASKAVLEEALPQLPGGATSLFYLIPTHVHIDHGGGAGYLTQHLPKTQVVVHPLGAPHLIDPARLITASRLSFGDNFEQTLGPVLPVSPDRIHLAQDGETLSLGDRELRVIFMPGHSPHHFGLWDSKSRGVFCGEALGFYHPGRGVIPSAARPRFDLKAALESMDKLENLAPRRLFISHNGVFDEVSKVISLARESAIAYGERVRVAMERGDSLEELARQMYNEAQQRGVKWREVDVAQLIEGYKAYFQEKAGKEKPSLRRNK